MRFRLWSAWTAWIGHQLGQCQLALPSWPMVSWVWFLVGEQTPSWNTVLTRSGDWVWPLLALASLGTVPKL